MPKNSKGFAWELRLQKSNSASMCKFRRDVDNSMLLVYTRVDTAMLCSSDSELTFFVTQTAILMSDGNLNIEWRLGLIPLYLNL